MWKYRSAALLSAGLLLATAAAAGAQDADAGARVFRKCKACHTVEPDAGNKTGPNLHNLFGRTAGTEEGYKYSKAMTTAGQDGLVWTDGTLTEYLANPRGFVKGNRMAFAGLKKSDDIADMLAYLRTFSEEVTAGTEASDDTAPKQESDAGEPAADRSEAPMAAGYPPADDSTRSKGRYGIGRVALDEEIAAWNTDIRPDGLGLPVGHGTVQQGSVIFDEQCAVCHGSFGEGEGRWPVLAGGQGTLTDERPVKTIGSYWPYLSTVYDYVQRAMPFGNARSLSDDDVYALTAYLLYLNDVVTDEEFELDNENFTSIHLPNEKNFFMDDRDAEPFYAQTSDPCMTDCKPEPARVTMRARILDVTPDGEDDDNAGGAID